MVIDQLEENLDNQTMYDLLVPCLRNAKKKRQVIIVTHNPNLAVVSDAEQIIHANLDKSGGNRMTYTSGALENPEINRYVLDVLEGTRPHSTIGRKNIKKIVNKQWIQAHESSPWRNPHSNLNNSVLVFTTLTGRGKIRCEHRLSLHSAPSYPSISRPAFAEHNPPSTFSRNHIPVFSITSTLFRSLSAPSKRATLLLSAICALFASEHRG